MPPIYPIDLNNNEEVERIERQGLLFNTHLGLLPPGITLAPGGSVLDVATGTGTWIFAMARLYPSCFFHGIDLSAEMIRFARAQARAHGIRNCDFQRMDAKKVLNLPNDTYDLVFLRLVFAFQSPETWLPLFRECLRVLRPGGILVSTEHEHFQSNAPSVNAYLAHMYTEMRAEGRMLAGPPTSLNLASLLTRTLKAAGGTHVSQTMTPLDASYGAPAYREIADDLISVFRQMQPYLLKQKTRQDTLDTLLVQAIAELEAPALVATSFFSTIWGAT